MNEVLYYKYFKKVIGLGINKSMAKEIVLTALETSNGKNIEMYINYAITLTYGLNSIKITYN